MQQSISMHEDHTSYDQIAVGVGPRCPGRGRRRPARVLLQVLQARFHSALIVRLPGPARVPQDDHRGIEALLRNWSDLRQALGLAKVPDHSTLQ